MKTKELEIPKEFMEEEWKTNKITIKKLTLGDEADLTDEISVPNRLRPNEPIIKRGLGTIITVLKSVVKAPWKVQDVQVVRDLDRDLAGWLAKEISNLNNMEIKKNENLKEPSIVEAEQPEK